jgi:D-alanine-D-alanine ligase
MNANPLPLPAVTPAQVRALGRVAVLMGGRSAEREVSLMSGQGVLAALRSLGVDAHAFDPATRSLHTLRDEGVARVFIALHGRHGEDGTVQGALELLGIPYTGSGVLASALAMDKTMTKRVWLAEGLPTPRWLTLPAGGLTRQAVIAVPDTLGLPLIVKPPREGSSIGIAKVAGYSEMQDAVAQAARFDADVLCEEFIAGQEYTCPVLGGGPGDDAAFALPVVRIDAPDGNYDYEHKYFSEDTGYRCPSGLTPAEEAEVQRLTLAAYQALGCRGWGRADLMRRASDGGFFLLEMNTSPGMTGHSLVPMAARAAGISYERLCLWLLQHAALDTAAGQLDSAPQRGSEAGAHPAAAGTGSPRETIPPAGAAGGTDAGAATGTGHGTGHGTGPGTGPDSAGAAGDGGGTE